MRRNCLFGVLILSVWPCMDAHTAEPPDPQSVIKQSIEAAGGLESLEKVQKARGTHEGTYYGGGQEFPYTAEFASDPPDKAKMDVHGVFISVLSGDKGWIRAGGTTQALTGEQLEEVQEQQYLGNVTSLVPLAKNPAQFELTNIEGVDVDGRETVGVQVSSEGHRDVKLYFDKDSHDLLKAEYKVRSSELGFAEVTEEVVVKSYMDVAGARVPGQMTILRDGEKYVEAKVTKIEPVEEFEEGVFAEP